jgi:hypothetical protein
MAPAMDETYVKQLYRLQINELAQRLGSGTPHDLYKASAILRQFFLDGGQSLVHLVNRDHHIKLSYHIASLPPNPDRRWQALYRWCSLIPSPHRGSHEERVFVQATEGVLMATACVVINDCAFTIRDMIKTAAHVMGGIHAGAPDEKQLLIVKTEFASCGTHPQIVGSLREIVVVVLAGLSPLTAAIIADLHANKVPEPPSPPERTES